MHINHKLTNIDNQIIWRTWDKSVVILEEPLIFRFYSPKKRDISLNQSNIEFSKEEFQKMNCKEKNDYLLSYFISTSDDKKKMILSDLEENAFTLLNQCKEKIIQKNAHHILYWISLYYEYEN